MTRLGLCPAEMLPRQRESIANQLANRILLPDEWFTAAYQQESGDLYRLKDRFATASHELIAWRMLDLPGERIVTVRDRGAVARRRCNFAERAPVPQPQEIDAWDAAHRTGKPIVREWSGGSVRVWPVHEPDWKREIAVTEVNLDSLGE